MSDVENNATENSLRDDLAAAFDGAENTSNDPGEVVADGKLGDSKTRDESGRFAKAKNEEQSETVAQSEPTPSEEPKAAVPTQGRRAPQGWKQEYKEHFNSLAPELQEEILRRESDYSKGIQRYAEDAKWSQSMRPVVDKWAPYMQQIGASPDQAIETLMQAEYQFRTGTPTQKYQLLMKLASDYGIPLGQQEQQNSYGSHPDVSYLNNQVSTLNQQIMQMQYEKQQAAQMQQQAEMFALQQQIDEFSSKPENNHFDDVREDMQALLAAGRAESLEDAYNKAIWARPDIRASLLKQEEAKRIQQQAEAANKAKGKASSITGSPSGASVPVSGASIRDDLRAALTAVGGRL